MKNIHTSKIKIFEHNSDTMKNEYNKFVEDSLQNKIHDMLITNVKNFSRNILQKLNESDYWKSKYEELESFYNSQSEILKKKICESSKEFIDYELISKKNELINENKYLKNQLIEIEKINNINIMEKENLKIKLIEYENQIKRLYEEKNYSNFKEIKENYNIFNDPEYKKILNERDNYCRAYFSIISSTNNQNKEEPNKVLISQLEILKVDNSNLESTITKLKNEIEILKKKIIEADSFYIKQKQLLEFKLIEQNNSFEIEIEKIKEYHKIEKIKLEEKNILIDSKNLYNLNNKYISNEDQQILIIKNSDLEVNRLNKIIIEKTNIIDNLLIQLNKFKENNSNSQVELKNFYESQIILCQEKFKIKAMEFNALIEEQKRKIIILEKINIENSDYKTRILNIQNEIDNKNKEIDEILRNYQLCESKLRKIKEKKKRLKQQFVELNNNCIENHLQTQNNFIEKDNNNNDLNEKIIFIEKLIHEKNGLEHQIEILYKENNEFELKYKELLKEIDDWKKKYIEINEILSYKEIKCKEILEQEHRKYENLINSMKKEYSLILEKLKIIETYEYDDENFKNTNFTVPMMYLQTNNQTKQNKTNKLSKLIYEINQNISKELSNLDLNQSKIVFSTHKSIEVDIIFCINEELLSHNNFYILKSEIFSLNQTLLQFSDRFLVALKIGLIILNSDSRNFRKLLDVCSLERFSSLSESDINYITNKQLINNLNDLNFNYNKNDYLQILINLSKNQLPKIGLESFDINLRKINSDLSKIILEKINGIKIN